MRHTLATALGLLSLGAAGVAFADDGLKIQLQNPVSGVVSFIAAGASFTCKDSSCTSGPAPYDAYSVSGCKEVAKQVGPVISYAGVRPLNDAALAKCNLAAAKPKSITTASH